MTSQNCLNALKHIVHNVSFTQKRKIMVVIDNHELHISSECVDYAKSNEMVILILLPHTYHKLYHWK